MTTSTLKTPCGFGPAKLSKWFLSWQTPKMNRNLHGINTGRKIRQAYKLLLQYVSNRGKGHKAVNK